MCSRNLWLVTTHVGNDGYLCIGCLETRIGRTLNADDFPKFPINDPSIMSARLTSKRLLDRLALAESE